MFNPFEKKYVVGIDLNDQYLQISYSIGEGNEVETVSSIAGAEIYNIPTALCKRAGVNQWYYGKEALFYAQDEENILIENLLSLAISGEPIYIEETEYDPDALLALFFKRCLAMLAQVAPVEKANALMVTCEKLDYRMLEVLHKVLERLGLKEDRVFFQSYTESFYAFMLRQPEELWLTRAMLFDYREDRIRVYQMECNRHTTPIVAYIGEDAVSFPFFEPIPEDEREKAEKFKKLDEKLLGLLQRIFHNTTASSVYLIGDGFRQEWMKDSLRFLCKGRRVFQGENLYSKGACYSAMEKCNPENTNRNYVFLGNDKLTTNVGMKVLDRGEEAYIALLDAGENWFEAEKTVDVYAKGSNVLQFQLTSLIGKGNAVARVTLEDMQSEVARLRIRLHLKDEKTLAVEITDLGFGSIIPSSGKVWMEEITL